MAKKNLTGIQQNKLPTNQVNVLSHINELLVRQDKIIQQQSELLSNISQVRDSFVENIDCDEMRNGFLVTSHRKKLWNVQIGLINEFARICKKHNLKWFACYGTLLGAARHKGFIPWDDDVDLAMLRPDYNKFIKIAAEEIKYPYFLDNWCNYKCETDMDYSLDSDFPLIKQSSFLEGHFPRFPIFKIRDCRTTMIEFPDRKNTNQGIWIDVFPFDPTPPPSGR